ncbi:MAG: RNA polymerase sigma factor [Planctomycetota bacterium]|jgi:RNA polymerase sigma-70 factor (ECF subfamily)
MRPKDQTDMGGLRGSFLTTHWSLIDGIQKHQDKDRSLISLLLERYWKPVYCYLRRKGYRNEEAKDLTQGFFHEIVLNRCLIERADSSKGRFRSFLLHALDQYLIDRIRRESTLSHIPKEKLVPLDIANPPELPQNVLECSPEYCFAYTWKSELLERTLAQVKADCEQQGMKQHWLLFCEKVLEPTLNNKKSEPMKVIAERFGIKSESTAFNMLLTVKRRFKTTLRANLRITVISEDDIDEEWHEMLNFFRKTQQKFK